MTATPKELPLELRLEIAKAQYKCLKTPALRREIRILEEKLTSQDLSTRMFQHVNSKPGKRRRGVKLAKLYG